MVRVVKLNPIPDKEVNFALSIGENFNNEKIIIFQISGENIGFVALVKPLKMTVVDSKALFL